MSSSSAPIIDLAALKAATAGQPAAVLAFGLDALDRALPGGGLPLGALHDIAGGGAQADHGAAACLFAAGILARLDGPVLWCLKAHDLFAPALAQAGLDPARVIHAEGGDDKTVLACLEEGLRHRAIVAAVGEVSRLPPVASRRLQLAASESGVTCLILPRWRAAADDGANAAFSRWRISSLPSAPLPDGVPGIGRARWRVELTRCRGANGAAFTVEACDEKGRLGLVDELVDAAAPAADDAGDRSAAPLQPDYRRRSA